MINIEEYLSNPTKKHILGLLIKNPQLKYSELMPVDVDNVLFNYHLQHLVKTGILNKNENYYSLSDKGKVLTFNITDTGLYFPKFVCRYKMYLIHDNKILLQHRNRTPFQGDITALSSKLVYGTNTEERANVRMKEKTNLDVNMKWIGTIRTIAFNSQKDLIDDSMYFICVGTSFSGNLNDVDDTGNLLKWYAFDEAIQLEKNNKGCGEKSVEILERFKSGNFEPFVFEEHIQVENL